MVDPPTRFHGTFLAVLFPAGLFQTMQPSVTTMTAIQTLSEYDGGRSEYDGGRSECDGGRSVMREE